jgi:hypothetical protein
MMAGWTTRWFLIAITFVLAHHYQPASVDASQQEKQLYTILLQGYNKQSRPVKRVHDTVNVRVGLSLVEVLGIDENNGQISIKAWLTMNWKDEYLTWNPELHGGIERLNFATGPAARIWTPDVIVFNSLHTDISDYVQAVVRSDGTVTWVQPAVYTVRCRHEFRGNSWVAGFQLGSWTYDERMLDLRPLPTAAASRRAAGTRSGDSTSPPADSVVDLDVEHFSTNDHWALLDHTGSRDARKVVCCTSDDDEPSARPVYVSMHYLLKLRKKLGPSLLGRRRRR